jgi:hypothetical protein
MGKISTIFVLVLYGIYLFLYYFKSCIKNSNRRIFRIIRKPQVSCLFSHIEDVLVILSTFACGSVLYGRVVEVYIFICVHIFYVYVYICIYVCVDMYINIHKHTHIYMYIYIYEHMYIHDFTYTYTYTYIYIYINLHIYICIQGQCEDNKDYWNNQR